MLNKTFSESVDPILPLEKKMRQEIDIYDHPGQWHFRIRSYTDPDIHCLNCLVTFFHRGTCNAKLCFFLECSNNFCSRKENEIQNQEFSPTWILLQ